MSVVAAIAAIMIHNLSKSKRNRCVHIPLLDSALIRSDRIDSWDITHRNKFPGIDRRCRICQAGMHGSTNMQVRHPTGLPIISPPPLSLQSISLALAGPAHPVSLIPHQMEAASSCMFTFQLPAGSWRLVSSSGGARIQGCRCRQ